jgi:hypothetical protein
VEIGVPVRVQTLAVMLPHAAGFESGHFFGLCHNDALYISVVVEGGSGPGLERAVLAVAARALVLVEDGPAKAMAMAVVVLAAALVAMD